MAYITKFKNKDLENILIQYNIIDYISYTPIYAGIQNSNYIINTKNKKFILTIFEDKFVIDNINFFLNLMIYCNNKKFFCPKPISDSFSNYTYYIDNKPSCIFSFLEGQSVIHVANHNLKSLGISLAKFHLSTLDFNESIKSRFNINFYNNIIHDFKEYFQHKNCNLLNIFNSTLNDFVNLKQRKLKKGIIHGDLFPDNVLFKYNKITGFLDFYFADINYLVSDIAIIIISWCFTINETNQYHLDLYKVSTLIKSYTDIREINSNDLDSINILCKIYCMRFTFTRLTDLNKQQDKGKIFTKNPDEYINKLLYLSKNNINFRLIKDNA